MERMLAPISAMVEKGNEAVIRGGARVCVLVAQVKRETVRKRLSDD